MENLLEWIKSRRSTRAYQERPVEKEAMEMVIEAGRYAPSGGNSQKTHFLAITNPEILNTLKALVQQEFAAMEETENMYSSLKNSIRRSKKGDYDFIYNAPVLILCANDPDYGNNIADSAVALENMMLMANGLDLGSVWINQLRWLNENPRILEYLRSLGLKENERVYGGLALGYPATENGLPQREALARHGNPVTYLD